MVSRAATFATICGVVVALAVISDGGRGSVVDGADRAAAADSLAETQNQAQSKIGEQAPFISVVAAHLEHYRVTQPDSTAPVALMVGPNPFSRPVVLFATLDTCSVTVRVANRERTIQIARDCKNLAPGPYFVSIDGPGLSSGIYDVQLDYAGRRVGSMRLGHFGDVERR